MPLYEYECQACHHRFEQLQRFSDKPIRVCPKCGKKKVKKLLSSPAIQFKGSGWYITDYQRKGTSSSLPDHSESEKKKEAEQKEPAKPAKESKSKSEKKD